MLLSPPKTEYSNYYDVARYNLTWKICIFLVLFMPILGFVLSSQGEIYILPTFVSTIAVMGLIFILWKIKKFYIPAVIFAVVGTLMTQFTFILYIESHHIVNTMWMMIIILFAFFTLGKVWGITTLVLNLIGIVYFLFFVLRDNLVIVSELTTSNLLVLSINFSIAFLLIYYLINQFIILSTLAENKYIDLTAKLELNNKEKTIMLKEIHHRVKNNLQVITSLLRLQSRDITHEESRDIFIESIDRVIAMSRIHEKIYQTEYFTKIDLEEYIQSLAKNLISSYSVEETLDLKIESNVEYISTKSLVPISLIFNELISNSIKFAFINRDNGEISLSIMRSENIIEIRYKDNGVWKNRKDPESFGMILIDSLTEQLNGSYDLSVDKGTEYVFKFTIDKDETEF